MGRKFFSSCLLLAVGLLAGCASGGGVADTGSTGAAPIVKSKNPSIVDPLTDGATVGQTLSSGATLNAGKFSATRITYDAATQKSIQAPPSATVQKNLSGGYDVTIAGKTTNFGYADQKPSGDAWEKATKSPSGTAVVYSMALWNAGKGERAGIQTDENGQTFHKILGYYLFDNTGTGKRERGHLIVGNTTDPLRMGLKTKTAAYDGYFYTNVTPSNVAPPDQALAATGGIKFVADFDQKTISGQSTSLQIREAGGSNFNAQNYTVYLKPTAINGTSFSGKMDSNFTYLNGVYSGQFYGGNAQEIAGVLIGTGGISVTEGFFTAVAEPVAPTAP